MFNFKKEFLLGGSAFLAAFLVASTVMIFNRGKYVDFNFLKTDFSSTPTCSLSFNPTNIQTGQTSTIYWNFGGGYTTSTPTKLKCTLTNQSGTDVTGVPASGSKQTVPYTTAGTETCSIYFNNSSTPSCTSNTLTVSSGSTPTMTEASFFPSSISTGQTSYLKWNSTGTTSVKATCKADGKNMEGLVDIEAKANNTEFGYPNGYPVNYDDVKDYSQISCEFTPYNGSTAGTKKTADLTIVKSAPTCSLSFNPTNIKIGETSTISWNFGGGYTTSTPTKLKCTLTNQSGTDVTGVPASGSKQTVPYTTAGTETCYIYFNDSSTPSCTSNTLAVIGGSTPTPSPTPTSTPTPTPTPTSPINGACGSLNGTTLSSEPSSSDSRLCSSGNPSSISGSGPWYWTCNGTNGGTNASCSANKTSVSYSPTVTVIPTTTYTYSYTAKVAPASGPATNIALLLSISAVVTLGVWVALKKIKG